jgi:pyruvate formate lyase activating enzyme
MIECKVCFHHCRLEEGQVGFCGGRKNEQGKNIPLYFGKVSSIALDPIEKKPLLKFYPGSKIVSIGSAGCNLKCPFCQNHSISMAKPNEIHMQDLMPKDAVDLAVKMKDQGNIGIAFTYNEPLINYEYVLETSRLAHAEGLKTVLVTNGTVETGILEQLLPYIDAYNIDLKGFNSAFYLQLCGDFENVKANIKLAHKHAHVEITTLIIPGKNDKYEDMEAQAKWLAEIDPDLPLHITRFFPNYLWNDLRPTPLATLVRLKAIADVHLNHVYLGNV